MKFGTGVGALTIANLPDDHEFMEKQTSVRWFDLEFKPESNSNVSLQR